MDNTPAATRNEVDAYLRKVRAAIASPLIPGSEGWVFVRRDKNKACLLSLCLTLGDVREVIMNLTIDNYCAGPCHDNDQPGELWEFGGNVEGREIYIKLKLAEFGQLNGVRVISFHEAERCLAYPFKKQKELGDDEGSDEK